MDRFPLPDDASYRYTQNFTAIHHGCDIMAAAGTPVLAVERGRVHSAIEPRGGKVAYLRGDSGATYFYGHLQEWALKVIGATPKEPLPVEAGDVIGKVGTTGNAQGRQPHLHFQVRRGSLVIDPFPELASVDKHKRGVATYTKPSGSPSGLAILVLLFLWSKG